MAVLCTSYCSQQKQAMFNVMVWSAVIGKLTSSSCLSLLEPSHHVIFGGGCPPTVWQTTSNSFPAETNVLFSRIETEVGFTEKKSFEIVKKNQ